MKIHEIEWFNEFECIGGECPQTCCKGWLIPLDEEDLIRYSEEKGRLGFGLFIATAGYTRTRINLWSGECRFHTKEGLCSLQLMKGHDYIPWACRSFPRFYRNYGEFEERYLDLSCIAAARLFVRNAGNIRIAEREGTPETKSCTTNDDTEYLSTLLNIREDMVKNINHCRLRSLTFVRDVKNTDKIGMLTSLLYEYACRIQDIYAKEGADAEVPAFTDYCKETGRDTDRCSSRKHVWKYSLLPLSPKVLDRFTEAMLYHFGQKRTGSELYRHLTKARSVISGYSRNEAGFKSRIEKFVDSNPSLMPMLYSYLSYYLYQYFLEAYETYSFRRIVSLGIIHTNMILLLLLVASERNPNGSGSSKGTENMDVSEDDYAFIIAIYNRKAYYNEAIQDDMYRIFESVQNTCSLLN